MDYASPTRRRFPWTAFILGFLFAHFLATAASMFIWGSRLMARFDTGAPPTVLEDVSRIAFRVLSFPMMWLIQLVRMRDPGVDGWGIFFVNSILWTVAACGVLAMIRPASQGLDRTSLSS
jgi:hypothetical protein